MLNYIPKIRSALSGNLVNMPGWRSDRKLVIIESDDWGSIRMPSLDVFRKFISNGFDLSGGVYNQLDTIESNDDLTRLFELLLSFKDSNGNPPVVTANMVMGNPDFLKIRQSGFSQYYFESVTETLKRYPDRDKVEFLWKKGNSDRIFHPQFHSREHVNIGRWMDFLKSGNVEVLFAFKNETTFSGNGDYNFMEVLDYNNPGEIGEMQAALSEGLDLFEKIFGYRSRSFIPPCYTWNSSIESFLFSKGVRYIQGLVIQFIPTGSFGNYKKKYHFTGNRNSSGQYYIIRNCFFEPSLKKTGDPVDECLARIKTAFKWHKPAVICSHRINYIGSLDKNNRSENLGLLRILLKGILSKWPDVEFITSDQLGDLISGSKLQVISSKL